MSFRTPSFRNRLSFFFVVIVIVPMVSVAVILFRLISDNESGKAAAAVAGAAQAASAIYTQDAASPGAALIAASIAHDPTLAHALQGGDATTARVRASQLLAADGVARIVLRQGSAAVFDVGDPTAVAPVIRELVDPQGRPLGRLEVSLTSAAQYAQQVHNITTYQVAVHDGRHVLASTLPGVRAATLPAPRTAKQLTVGNTSYRVATLPALGFAGRPLGISVLADSSATVSKVGRSRLFAAALIVVFLLSAIAVAVLVSRSLQTQIGDFLDAARRLGSGDFSAQVPIIGKDEFAALGEEFNKMSHQLEERLHEIRAQQGRLEGALRRIGETFASNLDRDALLEIMLRTAVDGVGATGGRAAVRDGPGRFEERVRVGSLAGHEPALDAVEDQVRRSGEPRNVTVDGVSALGHPLTAAQDPEQLLGLLSVARADRAFTPVERELFHYLAGQAAVSIENVDLHERVQRQAVTDELTGLFNHRRFHEAMATEVERSKRFRQSLGLIMLDIDDFKRVNDSFGHQQGDRVLREVARIVQQASREIDAPARYGGEELALVLPGTDLDGAYNLAERVRVGIETLRLSMPNGRGSLHITASLGVAAMVPVTDAEPSDLIAAADAALYRAKRAGKNRTVRAQ